MAGNTPEAAKQLSLAAAHMRPHLPDVSRDVQQHVMSAMAPLGGDDTVLRLLRASVAENVRTLLDVFENDIPPDAVGEPAAAGEYARRLAQRDVPVVALIRVLRIAHGCFLQRCLDELHRQYVDEELSAATTSRMLAVSFDHVDRVTEHAVEVYRRERERWLLNGTAGLAARVRDVLAEQDADPGRAESALGYRFSQHHLGLVARLPSPGHGSAAPARLDRFTAGLAGALDCPGRPLFVPQDETLAWAWLPLGGRDRVPWERLADVVEDADPSVRVCAGGVEPGIGGFRRTHRQALRAQELAAVASPGRRFTAWARVAPIALMCGNVDDLGTWVRSVLGPLAVDDEHSSRLRETLRIFLATGCSYTATAGRQILHKNTVQYRIRKAEEAMGHTVEERRTDLDVALLAVEHLGSVVLRRKPA
ncbi:PucR family transcriptional regulator [Streptomyces sp. NPDC088354]|uniref:PucR family transcriptional regulator n=1 Tax=unclassified Streptomyces TaxID=2593676 RepID=UPI0029BBA78B|nr:helix-turn-helix domain-containing protein [Streptomyces sp. MI02-7b]MDX3078031.1 helix-turn-helix domain-containing protein [Streptomyces sp. MI02-7b]